MVAVAFGTVLDFDHRRSAMEPRDERGPRPTKARRKGDIHYHPKSPGASVERLRELAGILTLDQPVPFTRFLDDEYPGESTERARD